MPNTELATHVFERPLIVTIARRNERRFRYLFMSCCPLADETAARQYERSRPIGSSHDAGTGTRPGRGFGSQGALAAPLEASGVSLA
jgi:hypothetical protein